MLINEEPGFRGGVADDVPGDSAGAFTWLYRSVRRMLQAPLEVVDVPSGSAVAAGV
jgi:hypothetical protein